jgi:hypothetical protein
MLHFKHPARFNAVGSSLWSGVIYGEGALGLPFLPPVIYHGRFGLELFPAIYRQNRVSLWAYFTLLEWHGVAAFAAMLSLLAPPLIALGVGMWSLTLISVWRSGRTAPLARAASIWSRGLVCILHLIQPIVRGWNRYFFRLRSRKLPAVFARDRNATRFTKTVAPLAFDLYWNCAQGRGRETLLERAVQAAAEREWLGDFHCHWEPWDLLLVGDNWHSIELRSATEELGGANRFTRVRARLRATGFAVVAVTATTAWSALAVWQDKPWAQWIAILACTVLATRLLISRRNCRRAVASLLWHAALRAGLQSVAVQPARPTSTGDPQHEIDRPGVHPL